MARHGMEAGSPRPPSSEAAVRAVDKSDGAVTARVLRGEGQGAIDGATH